MKIFISLFYFLFIIFSVNSEIIFLKYGNSYEGKITKIDENAITIIEDNSKEIVIKKNEIVGIFYDKTSFLNYKEYLANQIDFFKLPQKNVTTFTYSFSTKKGYYPVKDGVMLVFNPIDYNMDFKEDYKVMAFVDGQDYHKMEYDFDNKYYYYFLKTDRKKTFRFRLDFRILEIDSNFSSNTVSFLEKRVSGTVQYFALETEDYNIYSKDVNTYKIGEKLYYSDNKKEFIYINQDKGLSYILEGNIKEKKELNNNDIKFAIENIKYNEDSFVLYSSEKSDNFTFYNKDIFSRTQNTKYSEINNYKYISLENNNFIIKF